MDKSLDQLLELSHLFGNDNEFVIGGGGNTSWKDENFLFVKASGTRLGSLTAQELIKLDRSLLDELLSATFPNNPFQRDQLILQGMMKCCVDNDRNLRPSVETPLHHLLRYRFVIHTHPTRINALLCGRNCVETVKRIFPEDVLFVEYTDPGYVLFQKLRAEISAYRTRFSKDPSVILVQNHGVFISADSVEEINRLYQDTLDKVNKANHLTIDRSPLNLDSKTVEVLPAIRMLLSTTGIKILKVRQNALIQHFAGDQNQSLQVSLPFTPDNIVYCRARPLYVGSTGPAQEIIREFEAKLARYKTDFGGVPKIILINRIGLIAVDESIKMTNILLDVFEDLMKISFLSQSFGGPNFLADSQISFIENWESENYRHNMSRGTFSGKVMNKIIIVTGAAQGFGGGIAVDLFSQGANVIIADLNEPKGSAMADDLNRCAKNNRALFVRTDVSDPESVKELIFTTVAEFGGLDVLISNAGILHAGGLDEMSPETFQLMTKVNYTGYFLCAKYASAVLKIQAGYKSGYFTDIIQINSKSGLRGSKKNFTYAGGKFGGVGLTQSFALELIEYHIKVNSICPGNFFDGPLWSDPENGLFVQYLRSGKVPDAQTLDDVKRYYEKQVPAGRGCTVEDVMKAIYYVIDQEYETGQAIPVTGGQVMLN
ncbi:MAG: SDR family NAD(P)-dependent oxidoreductase [Bacteroidales bacterium]|jgi:NAD(P)-dependent dehydrogenase (short-subunit alcohol dehydrogenase family)/rhamnose utilization protein RhaD (predicted bifunctional aldolase and dehydrogenase)